HKSTPARHTKGEGSMEARDSVMDRGAGMMRAEQAIRICEACDRFEWDWLRGETPRIEQYLDEVSTDERPQLLEDLLRIEVEWRRDAGDRPASGEYAHRFPGKAALIGRILGQRDEEGDEEPMRRIGPYELIEEIGRGAEGVVYRARKVGIIPHEVAIKLMSA